MRTRRLFWLVLGLAVVLVAAFTAYPLHPVSLQREAVIDAAIQSGPLTISVSYYTGGRPPGGDWELQLGESGNATLKINSYPTGKTRQFVVPKGQLEDLRKAIEREHFFDLNDSYGQLAEDDPSTTLLVSAGQFSNIVRLHSLENLVREGPQQLREASRALRVLQMILAWFNDPEIVDVRNWNQRFIDAAGRK